MSEAHADTAAAASTPAAPSAGGQAAASGAAFGAAANGATTGGGGVTENPVEAFLAQIPEAIRGEAYFKDIKDVGNLATRAWNQAKLIGRDPETLVAIPGPDDQDGWTKVWDQLGRPAKPDEYGFVAPTLPEGLTIDEQLQTGFATKAHELGLSKKQAGQLYDWWNASRGAQWQAIQGAEIAAKEASVAQMRQEFGQAFDEKIALVDATIDALDREMKTNGGLQEAITAMPFESRLALSKLFLHIAPMLREDILIGGRDAQGASGILSPTEAQQQINALLADPQFTKAYYDKRQPGHDAAVARMLRLHEQRVVTPA